MRGSHPFPDRHGGDLATQREILSAIEELHARATAAGWVAVRAGLAMTIGTAREDIRRAEAEQLRPRPRPTGPSP